MVKETEKLFWDEYKRRLRLREERQAEVRRQVGWSDTAAGLRLVTHLPVADYDGANTTIRRDFSLKKNNIPTIRRLAPTTKG